MKYPLEDHVAENKAEEARCLDQVRSIIHQRREEGRPVAGMIIEPVQAEGGDRSATDDFYRNLRQLALDEGVSDIKFISYELYHINNDLNEF